MKAKTGSFFIHSLNRKFIKWNVQAEDGKRKARWDGNGRGKSLENQSILEKSEEIERNNNW